MAGMVWSEDDPSEMMQVDTADMMFSVPATSIDETSTADSNYQHAHSWPRLSLQRQIVSEAMSLSRAGSKPMGEILFGYSPLASTRLDHGSMVDWECAIWPSLLILSLQPTRTHLSWVFRDIVLPPCLERCYVVLRNSIYRIGTYPHSRYAVATQQEKRSWISMFVVVCASQVLARKLGYPDEDGYTNVLLVNWRMNFGDPSVGGRDRSWLGLYVRIWPTLDL